METATTHPEIEEKDDSEVPIKRTLAAMSIVLTNGEVPGCAVTKSDVCYFSQNGGEPCESWWGDRLRS